MKREPWVGGRVERDVPFSGKLPKSFQVARSLRCGSEFRFGIGEGVGVLLGAAPV